MKRHFLTLLLIALAPSVWAQRFVDGGGACGGNTPCYTTIQAAVNAAASGETITVSPGTYVESVTITGKNLTLISTGGKGSTIIQGVANGVGALVIDGSTTGFKLGTTASNGFTIIGFDNPDNASEVGAVVVKGGPHTNLSVVGNDIRAAGDDGFLHFYGTVINGLTFDSNTLSGQTFTGAQPEQTCCSGTCYFNSSFSNVARSLFSLNGGSSGPVVSNLIFTNNLITGTAGAGANGNILVQMTASSALVQRNAFLGATVTGPGALNSCNRGALRVRGTNFTVTCNQFSASGLSGNGAYYIQSDQTGASNPFAGGTAPANTLMGVAQQNLYNPNLAAYYNPASTSAPFQDYQNSVFTSVANAAFYAGGGGTAQSTAGTCANPLPVNLTSFAAKGIDNRVVKVDWVTATERNNNYFVLERSKDLIQFEVVARVNAKEGDQGHTYTYTDETPYRGTSYYRLRQVDLNNSVTNYPAVSVVLRSDAYGVFPNPIASDGQFTLILDEPQTATISLYSVDGRLMPLQKTGGSVGTLQVKATKKLSTGVYILSVEERGQVRQYRLVVE